jgi:hypothetical protein
MPDVQAKDNNLATPLVKAEKATHYANARGLLFVAVNKLLNEKRG